MFFRRRRRTTVSHWKHVLSVLASIWETNTRFSVLVLKEKFSWVFSCEAPHCVQQLVTTSYSCRLVLSRKLQLTQLKVVDGDVGRWTGRWWRDAEPQTTVQDCVSTSVTVKPLDIITRHRGGFVQLTVSVRTRMILTRRWENLQLTHSRPLCVQDNMTSL